MADASEQSDMSGGRGPEEANIDVVLERVWIGGRVRFEDGGNSWLSRGCRRGRAVVEEQMLEAAEPEVAAAGTVACAAREVGAEVGDCCWRCDDMASASVESDEEADETGDKRCVGEAREAVEPGGEEVEHEVDGAAACGVLIRRAFDTDDDVCVEEENGEW